jgi:hypothetical protein
LSASSETPHAGHAYGRRTDRIPAASDIKCPLQKILEIEV